MVSDFLPSLFWNKDHRTSVFVVTVLFLLTLVGACTILKFFTPREQLLAPIGVIFALEELVDLCGLSSGCIFPKFSVPPPIGKTVC